MIFTSTFHSYISLVQFSSTLGNHLKQEQSGNCLHIWKNIPGILSYIPKAENFFYSICLFGFLMKVEELNDEGSILFGKHLHQISRRHLGINSFIVYTTIKIFKKYPLKLYTLFGRYITKKS